MIVLVIIDIIDVSHIVALIEALSCPFDNPKEMTKFHLLAPCTLLSQFWLQNRNLPV